MVQIFNKTLSLEEFLNLPETKPANEYIKGQIIQKPMPQGKHSTIQGELVTVINAIAKTLGCSLKIKILDQQLENIRFILTVMFAPSKLEEQRHLGERSQRNLP
ncbi:Uma2 family endonuclease [Planktothrix mougeotii LEGE 06226]|uniref:Uma2 family endonuclease n=1 Tax=Planktothrix mougeotii LEGE 06226 TaxID=1828728 RepID=A0ABR9UAW0_9CYAN|nr:Uma2 family endonuclease [Planktothrix mougeotii LEGE 06226]